MMGHLQQVGGQLVRPGGELRLDARLGVAGQQDGTLADRDPEDERIVVPGNVRRALPGRRMQDLERPSPEIEVNAPRRADDRHPGSPCGVDQLLHPRVRAGHASQP